MINYIIYIYIISYAIIFRYYTTVDFPYFLQCYRGETSSTTGGQGGFEGTCGLDNSQCTREASAGRKKRSTGNRTQDWINSLLELDEPSGYAKRLLGEIQSRKEPFFQFESVA